MQEEKEEEEGRDVRLIALGAGRMKIRGSRKRRKAGKDNEEEKCMMEMGGKRRKQ